MDEIVLAKKPIIEKIEVIIFICLLTYYKGFFLK